MPPRPSVRLNPATVARLAALLFLEEDVEVLAAATLAVPVAEVVFEAWLTCLPYVWPREGKEDLGSTSQPPEVEDGQAGKVTEAAEAE